MAAALTILRALSRALRRDLGTFQTITGNNFFLFVVVLLQRPASAEFLLLILGLLLLFPLSTDPLAYIPPERLSLWPLSRLQHAVLRLASIAFSPVLWIALVLLILQPHSGLAPLIIGAAILIQLIRALFTKWFHQPPQLYFLLHIPRVPGKLGSLIRNNLREMLSMLDPYVALILAAGGVCYRTLASHPDRAAFPVLSLLVVLTLSTLAQSLFGLDGAAGLTRYRLLPLCGWQILLAKDLAYLAILGILVAPLSAPAGFTAGLVALAIGHHPSLYTPIVQKRWRFSGGTLIPTGLFQTIVSTSLGFATVQQGWPVLCFAIGIWMASLVWFGRAWNLRRHKLTA